MSLMMLSKGSAVSTLGLITGLYSLFTVIFEFPGGVFADLIGQKKLSMFGCSFDSWLFGYAAFKRSYLAFCLFFLFWYSPCIFIRFNCRYSDI